MPKKEEMIRVKLHASQDDYHLTEDGLETLCGLDLGKEGWEERFKFEAEDEPFEKAPCSVCFG